MMMLPSSIVLSKYIIPSFSLPPIAPPHNPSNLGRAFEPYPQFIYS